MPQTHIQCPSCGTFVAIVSDPGPAGEMVLQLLPGPSSPSPERSDSTSATREPASPTTTPGQAEGNPIGEAGGGPSNAGGGPSSATPEPASPTTTPGITDGETGAGANARKRPRE
jgi:hypothetical protein